MTLKPATIALVFDFDDTLAPDSTSQVLQQVGIDPSEFWVEHRRRLSEGWDQVPAFMQMMLEESRARDGAITRQVIEHVGKRLRFFRGVPTMFKRVTELIEGSGEFRAHFYVISSGFEDPMCRPVDTGDFEVDNRRSNRWVTARVLALMAALPLIVWYFFKMSVVIALVMTAATIAILIAGLRWSVQFECSRAPARLHTPVGQLPIIVVDTSNFGVYRIPVSSLDGFQREDLPRRIEELL